VYGREAWPKWPNGKYATGCYMRWCKIKPCGRLHRTSVTASSRSHNLTHERRALIIQLRTTKLLESQTAAGV